MRRLGVAFVVVAGMAGAAEVAGVQGVARADTVFVEPENVFGHGGDGSIISPLDIVNWNLASNDTYIEVAGGNDSKASPPTLGRVCRNFDVASNGTYRIWGRVIAPSVEDDSFWVQVNGGSWINWNQIALGSSWHWDHVHDNATPTTAATFSLTAGPQTVCIAYREDGTKLDLLVVTDDTGFNPTPTLSGAPATPQNLAIIEGNGRNVLAWQLSLGATSYTIQKQVSADPPSFTTLASGVNGHSYYHDTTQGGVVCYRIVAVASTGSSAPTEIGCGDADLGDQQYLTSAGTFALTSPMILDVSTFDGFGVPAGTGSDSLSAPPSTGWARWDFRVAKTVTLKPWLIVVAPDGNHDSFWVRVDNGAWIKWNNIVPEPACGWDDLHDSDNGGATVNITVGPGSHKIEYAYRERGSYGRRIRLTDDLSNDPGGCFD
jgi:hypothetical protein